MKASEKIKEAMEYSLKAGSLFDSVSEKLRNILDDDSVHIWHQTDGVCIAFHGGQENSVVDPPFKELDLYLKMGKEELLKNLNLKAL